MSFFAMVCSGLEGLIPILAVVFLVILMTKKKSFSFKPFGVGILVFVVFAKALESILHLIVLVGNHTTSAYFGKHPFVFALYAALAAGIFEEVGRYFAFRIMLKRFRQWKDGISYGLGHGGIEALLIGTVASIEAIVFGVLVNSGKFPRDIPATVSSQILILVHQPGYFFLIGMMERLMAICIQIALSLIVLYCVRKRKIVFLFLSIGLHTVTDFVPALYQAHVANLLGVEGTLLILSILSILFIVRSKRFYLN
ncbi:YhfC family intramembrane metalloprotease [Neobacillus pocheonensis]|uniref:YhfC family intramembrane metalloprotease n=1 Tax=Neobacillus pocheonensis TaxID=363869 RepID=A0ABT0WEX0_9BACI|nr:YhfC family intramembrane metalloprotease [Neobacillus pocheonensis]